ncbi:MAG: type VII toxin-antitoxin system HepT family RNase toxin [Bacillota bacterium]
MLSENTDVVRSRLNNLEEYINDLDEYREINSEKIMKDKLIFRYLTRTLYLVVDTMLDIGCYIISSERLENPNDNSQIIEILGEDNIIKENEDNYIELAEFRDSIVHDAEDIDPEVLLRIIKENLSDLKAIFRWYKEYID